MQAIARVNRTFRDKPGGLIVDYIGIAQNLRAALTEYSPSDRDQAGVPIDEIVAVMLEKHEVLCSMLHDHSWTSDPTLPPEQRLTQLALAVNFVLDDPDRKARFMDQSLALLKAFALVGGMDAAAAIRNDTKFFADVRAGLAKMDNADDPERPGVIGNAGMETAIAQLVSQAVSADEVIDIYAAAGMERPDISILSDEFLEGLKQTDRPNLQMELLKKLLNDEIRTIRRKNVVQARQFSELLDAAIAKYTNRSLTSAEIIAELVELAKQLRDGRNRGTELGLAEDEVAFYDAIVQNDSAVLEMGDDTLKEMAHKLVDAIRESATIDWNLKEGVRAAMRAKIKRLLTQYDYPPDKEEKAVQLVLEQAELFATEAA
jgi:type I restriction enzyme R subunit